MSSSVNTFSMSPAMITRSLPKHFKTNFTLIDCLSMFTFPPNTGDSLSHEVEEVLLQCLVNYTNWNCFEIFKASIPCFPLDPPCCSPGSWPERTGLALSSSACWPSSCLTLAFSWGETTHCLWFTPGYHAGHHPLLAHHLLDSQLHWVPALSTQVTN